MMKLIKRSRRWTTRRVALAFLLFLSSVSINVAADLPDNDVRPAQRLIESIWQTLRDAVEKTSQALSSPSGAATSDDPSTSRGSRLALSSQRISLKTKTLRDHFRSFLVGDSPQLQSERSRNQRARVISNMRQTHRKALRWKEIETSCYLFADSVHAFWSFQWCPNTGVVLQGLRKKDGTFEPKYLLGTVVAFPSNGKNTQLDQAETFARILQAKYQNAVLAVYRNGDPCGKGNRRMAVALYHEDSSEFCAGDWTEALTDLAIESVEEPHECIYLINVCSPRGPKDESEAIEANAWEQSISRSNYSNQTISVARRIWKTYTADSTADMRRKLSPDRTTSLHTALPPLPPSRVRSNLQLVRDMFSHAYDSYMAHAFPASDIKPMTCEPASFNLVRVPGLTLIDALDTLLVMGNYTEFARAVERLRGLHEHARHQYVDGGLFALNQNVSVFETNIRVLGGLLSAHQLAVAFSAQKVLNRDVWSKDKEVLIGILPSQFSPEESSDVECDQNAEVKGRIAGEDCLMECTVESIPAKAAKPKNCRNTTLDYWVYDGFLLKLAEDLGDRLLPAFGTKTGIPYGTVNLLFGVPQGETPIASLAGGGTLTLEMELLSRLTGNPDYGRAAKLATRALWMRRSDLDLLGKHICSDSGVWTETLSGIGSNSDSFYEYLAKHYFLFPEDADFWLQLKSAYDGIFSQSRSGEWYGDVDFTRGGGVAVRRVFEALMAFYPGMQVILGELSPAACSLNSFFLVREHLGFLPERFNYLYWRVDSGGGHHFLRPELLESAYFMHRASKGYQQQNRNGTNAAWMDSSGWQWAGDFALHALEEITKTTCGYASLKGVSPGSTGNMGAFSSSSGPRIQLLNEMPSFFLSETLKYLYLLFDDDNLIHVDTERDWIMTTEAHPIHHVDVSRPPGEKDDMQGLKERLIRKLVSRAKKRPDEDGDLSSPKYDDDKWTESSTSEIYTAQLLEVRPDSNISGDERTSYGPDFWPRTELIQLVLPRSHIHQTLDAFHEVRKKSNAAHVTFGRLGLGNALKKSCPNFYLSDWLWIQALNGGIADYSEAYVSSAADNPSHDENRFHITGSLECLALYGRGVHVSELFWESDHAILDQQTTSMDAPTTPENESSGNTISLGEDLGVFDVSAFQEGSGFLIRRAKTGETVVATLINDDESGDGHFRTYVMVHSVTPVVLEPVHSSEESAPPQELYDHSVVMADAGGGAFVCKVELILKDYGRPVDLVDPEMVCREEDLVETVLASYPCTPAMFGPVHMQELANGDGLVVESSLIGHPNEDDRYGCNVGKGQQMPSSAAADAVREEGSGVGPINFVQRGHCSFEEKSFLQKEYRHAQALVVINNAEDELFVMSRGGSNAPDGYDSADLPPTVLVTGAHGKELLHLADSFVGLNSLSHILTRISITRDQAEVVQHVDRMSVQNNQAWPAVRASPDGIQIFSEAGWCVHAIQRSKEGHEDSLEWQVFLMPHDSAIPSPSAD